MEQTETKSELDAVGEVVMKQETLAEEDGSRLQYTQTHQPRNTDLKYPTVQIQNKEECPRVYCLPRDTYVKKEQMSCDGEPIVICRAMKTKDVTGQTSSTHLEDTIKTGKESSVCKIKTEPIIQHTGNVPLIPKTDMHVTNPDCADSDFHSSPLLPHNLAFTEIPHPVALYQRIQPLASEGGMPYEYNQNKSHHNIALKSSSILSTSSNDITSDNVTSGQRLEREKGIHRCSVCDCKNTHEQCLANHPRIHMREKQIKCSVCDYNPACKSHLVRHMRTHTGEKPYECSVCDYTSAHRNNLVSHERRHTGEKPYICSVCDYSSSRKGSVVIHMRTHTGEKPYKCSVCDYSSSRKDRLSIHLRTHTGQKPYKCSVCDFSTGHQLNLTLHARTHTGEKPYRCSICDYSSACRSNLVSHMRTHTGEKPYKCPVCDYSSSEKGALVIHMRIHTGEKPYKCSVCDYSSAVNSNVLSHMRRHTGGKPYKRRVCKHSSSQKDRASEMKTIQ